MRAIVCRNSEQPHGGATWRGSRALVGALVLATCLTAGPCWAGGRRDAAVATTDWGSAVGRVYDAVTGTPIAEAQVVVEEKGAFASEGRTVAKTDKVGRYDCRAPLGRISTKYSAAGVLGSALGLGGLLGPVSTTTRRIDATQFSLRVTKEGYHPFEGVARCRTSSADRFYVSMEPVLLTPAESAEVSTTADGWGALRILEVTVEPALAHPRDKVKVTARVQAPAAAAAKEKGSFLERLFGGGPRSQLALGMYSPLWRRSKGLALVGEEEGVLRFEGEIGLPKSVVSPSTYIIVVVERSPVEVVAGQAVKRVLLQVIPKEADTKAAELRLSAARLQDADDNPGAAVALRDLSGLPDATLDDLLWLASVSEQVHDQPEAVRVLKQALRAIPDKARSVVLLGQETKPDEARWEVLGRYASALLKNGQAEAVIAEVLPEVEKVSEKERPKRVPASVMVALGGSYLQLGKLTEAQEVKDKLADWPAESTAAAAREFRHRLRLAASEKAVSDDPANTQAWAEWGRALVDEGRWEEAVVKLQTALEHNPDMPAVRRDLAYALLHLQGRDQTVEQQLDGAIAAAERQVGGTQGVPESKSFYDWHTLGLLRYRKAYEQHVQGDPAEARTLEASQQALIQAVKYGRAGADVEQYITFTSEAAYSTREVKIAGFAYPEAACDYLVLDSLEALGERRDDYLTWFALATALLDLQQPELAEPVLRECQRLKPDFPETQYAQAMLALQQGNRQEAVQLLQAVLAVNPRHPFANRKLAELYAEDGDIAAAAGCLAAHAAVYQ